MKYTFRSETETVYLNADYKLVILSSAGVALENGTTLLSAVVRRLSDGTEAVFDSSCFTWTRHEDSEGFAPVTGKTLTVTASMLVNGSATFICSFSKPGLYWKDTATIVIEETVKGEQGSAGAPGANAPYQRTIYMVAENKPSKPGGNTSVLPSGWSLQPPPRTNGWKVWASVGMVSFGADNTPIYSEWSDPVEWSGETALPIVQWRWGDSDEYPPGETNAVLIIDGEIILHSDDNSTDAFVVPDQGEWADSIPDKEPGKPYLWKREYNYQHVSAEDEWFYYVTNPKGMPGDYESLGYIIVGTNTVIFAGLDEEKNPTLPSIHIFIQDISYYFPSIQRTLNEKSDVFYLVSILDPETGMGALEIAYLAFMSDGETTTSQWIIYDSDAIIDDGFVLAEIRMNGSSIRSVNIITPRRFSAYEKTNFMEILNGNNVDDINIAAEALGIERVFTRIAGWEAFFRAIFANEIEITYSPGAGIIGSIHSTDYNRGDYNNDKIGFYLGADGRAEFVKAILRDATIVSKAGNGEIIFQTRSDYSSGTFVHTETGTRKCIEDIAPKYSGSLQVNGESYRYEYKQSQSMVTPTNYFCLFSQGRGTYSYTSTALFSCQLNCRFENSYFSEGSMDVYVNGSNVFSKSGMFTSGSQVISVTEGDTIRMDCSGRGNKFITFVTHPTIAGTTLVSSTYDSDFFIYKQSGSGKWLYAEFDNLYLDPGFITGISRNGKIFDEMISRHPDGISNTVITDINASSFSKYTEYTADEGSTVEINGDIYNIDTFYFSESAIYISTKEGKQISIIEDNYVVNINISVSSIRPSVNFDVAEPITSNSSIGSSGNPYGSIYVETANISGKRLTSKSQFPIYAGEESHRSNGGLLVRYYFDYEQYVMLYSDGFVHMVISIPSIPANEHGRIDFNINGIYVNPEKLWVIKKYPHYYQDDDESYIDLNNTNDYAWDMDSTCIEFILNNEELSEILSSLGL